VILLSKKRFQIFFSSIWVRLIICYLSYFSYFFPYYIDNIHFAFYLFFILFISYLFRICGKLSQDSGQSSKRKLVHFWLAAIVLFIYHVYETKYIEI
jgi:hypothetical protein